MRLRTLAITSALLCASSALYLFQLETAPTPPPPATATAPPPLPPAPPPPPLQNPTTVDSKQAEHLEKIIAQIPPDGDDSLALEAFAKNIKFTQAAQIIEIIKTRPFSERERGIYHALGDEFGHLATAQDIALVATTYRQMPPGPPRDDIATLLRTLTRREHIPALVTILRETTQPGAKEPALLAGTTHALSLMANPPTTELLLQAASGANPPQLAALQEGMRALRDRTNAPTLIAVALGSHTLSTRPNARQLAIALIPQVPTEHGRDALITLAQNQDTTLAEAATQSLEKLRQTAPALFPAPTP